MNQLKAIVALQRRADFLQKRLAASDNKRLSFDEAEHAALLYAIQYLTSHGDRRVRLGQMVDRERTTTLLTRLPIGDRRKR